jgi:hypothetical protein
VQLKKTAGEKNETALADIRTLIEERRGEDDTLATIMEETVFIDLADDLERIHATDVVGRRCAEDETDRYRTMFVPTISAMAEMYIRQPGDTRAEPTVVKVDLVVQIDKDCKPVEIAQLSRQEGQFDAAKSAQPVVFVHESGQGMEGAKMKAVTTRKIQNIEAIQADLISGQGRRGVKMLPMALPHVAQLYKDAHVRRVCGHVWTTELHRKNDNRQIHATAHLDFVIAGREVEQKLLIPAIAAVTHTVLINEHNHIT